jgi:type I restriction enzyme, R subunit
MPHEAANVARFVARITGDSKEGRYALDPFLHPEQRYPVIATTSKLLTTGVDARTCKLIVLDQHIESMIEFKQIVGRGTRVHEDAGKLGSPSWTSRRPPSTSPTRTSTAIPW